MRHFEEVTNWEYHLALIWRDQRDTLTECLLCSTVSGTLRAVLNALCEGLCRYSLRPLEN